MKKNLLLLASCFLALASAKAQTNISGFININTTWNLAGSPYIVVGNTLLSQGYTLTIDPGVVVKFNDSCALQIDGELHAIGTANQRITFTSNQPIPAPGDWAKIHFADTCMSALFDAQGNYLSGCIMKYCDVMYGGGLGFGEIHIESSSPYLSQCRIMYSASAGIYNYGYAYLLDSSNVSNCTGYGLYFFSPFREACTLAIQHDTISNNSTGGIFLRTYGNICSNNQTQIRNNYFVSNLLNGAILFDEPFQNVTISENVFLTNESNGINYGTITFTPGTSNSLIECNKFINNQSTWRGVITSVSGAISGSIRNNLFDGNIASFGASVVYIPCSNYDLYFVNNYVINNTSLQGTCCKFFAVISNTPHLFIRNNEFSNNNANSILYMDVSTSIPGDLNFLDMKLNNFIDPNSQYELYNNIPYGQSNLYVDSNYWGTLNYQHIDSVIYDYFDFANQSVVYYIEPLVSPAYIDTTCPVIPVGISSSQTGYQRTSTFYPNPFSTTTTIIFREKVHNATFSLYNLLGEEVKTISGISAESFQIDRENLKSGIYIFEVIEGRNRIAGGKAVIY
jgi:hypothetical protein